METTYNNVNVFAFKSSEPTSLYKQVKDMYSKDIENPYFEFATSKKFISDIATINRLNEHNTVNSKDASFVFYHLYFTVSTKVINKGDWFINPFGSLILCKVGFNTNEGNHYVVIASTDKQLGLPMINSNFPATYAKYNGVVRQKFTTKLYLYNAEPQYVSEHHRDNAEPSDYTMEILAQTLEEAIKEASMKCSSNYHDLMMQLETNKSFLAGVQWMKNNKHFLEY